MKIGAHVSTAGGVDKAIDRASLIEAEAVQIFVSSPRGWTFKPLDAATITLFREKSVKSSINPVVFHGIYLVSLGTDNQENLEKGVQSLINYMTVSEQLDALGVVFHAGSHKVVDLMQFLIRRLTHLNGFSVNLLITDTLF